MKITFSTLLSLVNEPKPALPPLEAAVQTRIHERVMEKIGQPRRAEKKLRRLRPLLVGAAAVLLLCVTAGATYHISHAHTKSLMEAGPRDGIAQEISADSLEVIDTFSQECGITAEDGGVSVTLESVMGFRSEHFSAIYLTVTLSPPEETISLADVDLSGCSFDGGFLTRADGTPPTHSGSGSQTAVANPDGTISTMLAWELYGDVGGIPLSVTLKDFGGGYAENAPQVAGTWTFDFTPELHEAARLDFDPALFSDAGLELSEIRLSPFGGTLTMTGYTALMDMKFRALVQERYGWLDLDWENITQFDPQFEDLYEAGELTLEQLQEIHAMAGGSVKYFGDEAISFQVALEYPDGTVYDANTEIGVTASEQAEEDQAQEAVLPFLFEAPQDVASASCLIVEGVRIPLRS